MTFGLLKLFEWKLHSEFESGVCHIASYFPHRSHEGLNIVQAASIIIYDGICIGTRYHGSHLESLSASLGIYQKILASVLPCQHWLPLDISVNVKVRNLNLEKSVGFSILSAVRRAGIHFSNSILTEIWLVCCVVYCSIYQHYWQCRPVGE